MVLAARWCRECAVDTSSHTEEVDTLASASDRATAEHRGQRATGDERARRQLHGRAPRRSDAGDPDGLDSRGSCTLEAVPGSSGAFGPLRPSLPPAHLGLDPRATEIRKLVGELLVQETEDRVEIWAAHCPEAALLKVAGASEQICVVAGVRFGNRLLTLPRRS